MNNQARTCNLKCKYNIQGICHAYGKCIAKDLFIEELEKIKTEIENIRDVEVADGCVYVNIFDVNEIIDQRISELKGKQE